MINKLFKRVLLPILTLSCFVAPLIVHNEQENVVEAETVDTGTIIGNPVQSWYAASVSIAFSGDDPCQLSANNFYRIYGANSLGDITFHLLGNTNATYNLIFSDFTVKSQPWHGAVSIKNDGGVSNLNIYLIGDNSINAYNHPAMYVVGSGTVNINFILLESTSRLTLKHQYSSFVSIFPDNVTCNINVKTCYDMALYTGSTLYQQMTLNELVTKTYGNSYQVYLKPKATCSFNLINDSATCTESGYKTYKCNTCGYIYSKASPVSSLGHDYGSWTSNEDRTHSRVCSHDSSHKETANCTYAHVVTKEPTCEEEGIRTYTCSVCGDSYEEAIPALNHNYGDWFSNDDGTHSHVCDNDETHVETEDCEYSSEVTLVPTCEEEGVRTYTCIVCGGNYEEVLPALGHILEIRNATKATTEVEGYTGDKYCIICGELVEEGHSIEKISKSSASEGIKEIFTEKKGATVEEQKKIEEEQKKVEEALETISEENLVEIANVTNNTYNELSDALSKGDITIEEYEAKVEIVEEITKNAVVVGAQIEQASDQGNEVQNLLPEDSGIDMGNVFNDFYQKVLDDLLGNKSSSTKKARYADDNKGSSLDLNTSVDVYKAVGEFVDSSVSKMTDAALLIRQCSGERLKTSVKKYISKVSVSSFRDFDKTAADNEFVENAKEAIMINLQQQVLASLEANYNQAINSGKYSGNALENLKEEYDKQIEAVNDIETFEIMIVEVMRQKYVSIVNNKYKSSTITYDEYNTMMDLANSVDTFEPIYDEIFRSWALNTTNEYGISLEELSNSAIEDQGRVSINTDKETALSTIEIVIIAIIGGLSVALAATFIVMRLGKGSVVA